MLGAAFLSALGFSCSLVWSVPTASAAGAGNAEAGELVRLINGERAALGEAPLRVDTFLATKARDGAVACPNNAGLVAAGRAEDFAVYGYPKNSHLLRLCPTYTAMDAMKMWGYRGGRGEVTAVNGGYGTGQVDYRYGCTPTLRTCPGATTSTYYTTARVLTNWTSSSTHYAVIVGKYDRIGCGAWIGSDDAFYYDCMVSMGGRVAPKPPAVVRSTSVAKAPVATAGPEATTAASASAPAPTPTTTRPNALAMAAPTAGEAVAGVEQTQSTMQGVLSADAKGGPQRDPPNGYSTVPPSRDPGPTVAALVALMSFCYVVLAWLRPRRRRGAPAIG
jgi:hypothetical protein